MGNKFKTPKIDTQNVISFTCSDDSIEPLLELFDKLRSLGQMGSSREVSIDWYEDKQCWMTTGAVESTEAHLPYTHWRKLPPFPNEV